MLNTYIRLVCKTCPWSDASTIRQKLYSFFSVLLTTLSLHFWIFRPYWFINNSETTNPAHISYGMRRSPVEYTHLCGAKFDPTYYVSQTGRLVYPTGVKMISAVVMTPCKNVPSRACASVRRQKRENCWKHVHKVSFWRVPLRFVNTFQFALISRRRNYVPTRISKVTP
jgi:hypothetical protein